MSRLIEIRSSTPGELDTFYHWLKDNHPELLSIPGLQIRFNEAGMMGMPGKTVIKIVYNGPDKVSAEVGEKLEQFKLAVESAGGTLRMEEVAEGFFSRVFRKLRKA